MRWLRSVFVVLVVALLLAGCGGDSDSRSDVSPATPPAATPTAVPQMSVGRVLWAEEIDTRTGEPETLATIYTPDSPTIIAAMEVTDVPAGTEFTATWTINDQPIPGADMRIEAEGDLPHAWLAFRFTREGDRRYPVGQLGVVITTSTGVLREGSIEIGFAP